MLLVAQKQLWNTAAMSLVTSFGVPTIATRLPTRHEMNSLHHGPRAMQVELLNVVAKNRPPH